MWNPHPPTKRTKKAQLRNSPQRRKKKKGPSEASVEVKEDVIKKKKENED